MRDAQWQALTKRDVQKLCTDHVGGHDSHPGREESMPLKYPGDEVVAASRSALMTPPIIKADSS
jgi:hypothetical protein